MGKKISIDSATLVNKLFEVIEAQRLFDIDINKISIKIHPKSYIHTIVSYNNGMIELIAHDTDMKIQIFNTLYENENKQIKSKKLDPIKNYKFSKLASKRLPKAKVAIKLIGNLSNTSSYKYNDDDVNKIFKSLSKAMRELRKKFK